MKALATFLVLLNFFTRCHGWTCTNGPQNLDAAQIDAGNGMVVMTDKNNSAFFLSGSSWSKLGSVPLKHVSVGPAGIWGVDPDNILYKFAGGDFIRAHGGQLNKVDAGGEGEVLGVNSQNVIRCLKARDASSLMVENFLTWNTITGGLMYISCGPVGCWGVNSAQNIYFSKISPGACDISSWTKVEGYGVKVEVGTNGKVFLVNQSGNVYERAGISGSVPAGNDWNQITFDKSTKHLTYDLGRLWLLTNTDVIKICI